MAATAFAELGHERVHQFLYRGRGLLDFVARRHGSRRKGERRRNRNYQSFHVSVSVLFVFLRFRPGRPRLFRCACTR